MDDKAAFDRMFNEWYAQFVYFAYYFVNDVEVCRDIVSDAFEYLCSEVTKRVYFIGNERMLIAHDSNRLRFS